MNFNSHHLFSYQQWDLVISLSRKVNQAFMCFLDSEKTWFEWLIPNLFWWMVNAAVVAMVLARIMVFGEPVTKPLSESSVCYWRNRKQADLDLANVRYSIFHLYAALALRPLAPSPLYSAPPPPCPRARPPYFALSESSVIGGIENKPTWIWLM